jgi:heme/copper-type cytochrome/quinol oxidase subunit 4
MHFKTQEKTRNNAVQFLFSIIIILITTSAHPEFFIRIWEGRGTGLTAT